MNSVIDLIGKRTFCDHILGVSPSMGRDEGADKRGVIGSEREIKTMKNQTCASTFGEKGERER